MTEKPIKDIRSALTEKTVDILAGYRKAFSGTHPPGQLVLPENLKEFSMYILGLLKSRAFKGTPTPTLCLFLTHFPDPFLFCSQRATNLLTAEPTSCAS